MFNIRNRIKTETELWQFSHKIYVIVTTFYRLLFGIYSSDERRIHCLENKTQENALVFKQKKVQTLRN